MLDSAPDPTLAAESGCQLINAYLERSGACWLGWCAISPRYSAEGVRSTADLPWGCYSARL